MTNQLYMSTFTYAKQFTFAKLFLEDAHFSLVNWAAGAEVIYHATLEFIAGAGTTLAVRFHCPERIEDNNVVK